MDRPPPALPIGWFERSWEAARLAPSGAEAQPWTLRDVWGDFGPEFVQQRGPVSVDLTRGFAFEAWVWFGGPGHEPLFQWSIDDGSMREVLLRRHSNGNLQLFAHDGERHEYVWGAVEPERWYHVAASVAPGRLALHVDGELLAAADVQVGAVQSEAREGVFRIGSAAPPGGGRRDFLRGAVAAVAFGATFDETALRASHERGRPHLDGEPSGVTTGKVGFYDLYRAAVETPVDYEANVRAAYEAILERGDVAVDVGAHSGKHAIPMAQQVGTAGRVFAFEPLATAFESLERAMELHGVAGWVEAHNVAVSDSAADEVPFFRVENRPGQSGLEKRARYEKPEWRPVETTVRVVTLDEAVRTDGRVRFIKTDVEGSELSVFRGALRLIEHHRPVVHFELDAPSYEAFDVEPSALYRLFADRGYVLFDILGRRLPSVSLFLASDAAKGVYDYVAVPREEPKLGALRDRLLDGWL